MYYQLYRLGSSLDISLYDSYLFIESSILPSTQELTAEEVESFKQWIDEHSSKLIKRLTADDFPLTLVKFMCNVIEFDAAITSVIPRILETIQVIDDDNNRHKLSHIHSRIRTKLLNDHIKKLSISHNGSLNEHEINSVVSFFRQTPIERRTIPSDIFDLLVRAQIEFESPKQFSKILRLDARTFVHVKLITVSFDQVRSELARAFLLSLKD